MRQWIRSHLTYANVMSTLAVFLVIGGGTALASYVVSANSQVGPNTISGHRPPTGKHANILANSINGTDIADRTVDTCQVPLKKFGPICARSDGGLRTWDNAFQYCAGLGLRLPTTSEADVLALKYDVPGVANGEYFWADDEWESTGLAVARVVNESGGLLSANEANSYRTVCVTDPSA